MLVYCVIKQYMTMGHGTSFVNYHVYIFKLYNLIFFNYSNYRLQNIKSSYTKKMITYLKQKVLKFTMIYLIEP